MYQIYRANTEIKINFEIKICKNYLGTRLAQRYSELLALRIQNLEQQGVFRLHFAPFAAHFMSFNSAPKTLSAILSTSEASSFSIKSTSYSSSRFSWTFSSSLIDRLPIGMGSPIHRPTLKGLIFLHLKLQHWWSFRQLFNGPLQASARQAKTARRTTTFNKLLAMVIDLKVCIIYFQLWRVSRVNTQAQ